MYAEEANTKENKKIFIADRDSKAAKPVAKFERKSQEILYRIAQQKLPLIHYVMFTSETFIIMIVISKNRYQTANIPVCRPNCTRKIVCSHCKHDTKTLRYCNT